MAFTEIFDNTFPLDTQVANLLGQDIRNTRLDLQERMAAISGLDAAKPAFGADTQPTKWNGLLFFATDTGKVYQFTNPNWVDITPSLRKWSVVNWAGGITINGTTVIYGPLTGGPALNTTESTVQIAMPFAGVCRSLYVRTITAMPAGGALTINVRKNGVTQTPQVVIPSSGGAGVFSDVIDSFSFNIGDLLDLRFSSANSAASAQIASYGISS